MPPRPLRLAQRSNPGRDPAIGSARLVNCYTEAQGEDGKAAWPIVAAPGLKHWLKLSVEGCRGLHVVDDQIALAVYGTDIIEIQKEGTFRVAGGIAGSGLVTFGQNRRPSGTQVAIVSGPNRRVYDAATGGATVMLDADLPVDTIGCDAVATYVLYFLANGSMYWSASNDAASVAALDFIEAESSNDGLVRGIVHEGNVWLFGPRSTEVWGLTQNADAPFARLPGAAIAQGCVAAATVVRLQMPSGGRLAWIADDRTVRMSAGYAGERISEHAVERAVGAIADPSTIDATSYTLDGHVFLSLSSPQWTWVWNATTRLWHEEASYGLGRRRIRHAMSFAGRTLVGDYASSRLHEVGHGFHDDDGSPLVCDIVTPPDHAYPHDIEYNALYIDTVPGSGLVTGEPDQIDPALSVRWSFDGGRRFGKWRTLKTGKVGQHKKRVATHALGTSGEDGAVFHIQWSPAIARAVTQAAVDAQGVAA